MKTIKTVTAILAMCPIFAASGAMDITAYMRNLGSGYSVSGGSLWNATPAGNAVDGVGFERSASGAVNYMRIISDGSGGYKINPAYLDYKFQDGRTAMVTAFTVYRFRRAAYSEVGDNADLARTPKRFKLQARNDNSSSWTTLFETSEDVVWGRDIVSNRFEISESVRNSYAQYRFALDLTAASNQYWSASYSDSDYYTYHELVLEGVMTLSWTGDANDKWSGADANWSDGASAKAWEPSAIAVFNGGNDVSVSGTQTVGGIKIGTGGKSSISGGMLAVESPACFDIGSATTISSSISDADGANSPIRFDVNSVSSVLDGRGGSYLPRSDFDDNTGEAVLCWMGRSLSDITSISSCAITYGAASTLASVFAHYANDGDMASFQAQIKPSNYIICVKVELTQVGNDIHARAVYARRKDNVDAWPEEPLDFDTLDVSRKILDDEHNAASDGYGVRNIRLNFRENVRIDGAFTSGRDVVVNGNTLSFGAPSLSFGQDVSGTGTVRFSPASGTQTVSFGGTLSCDGGLVLSGETAVTVSDDAPFAAGTSLAMDGGAALSVGAGSACTVGAASFSGTTAINIAGGGTIEFDAVSFSDGAEVVLTVPGRAKESSVRVGTSASLSASELAHFISNGKPVRSQTEDGWLVANDSGLVLIVR